MSLLVTFDHCPGFALDADQRQTPGTLPASLLQSLRPEIEALPPKMSYAKSKVESKKDQKDNKEKKQKKEKKGKEKKKHKKHDK